MLSKNPKSIGWWSMSPLEYDHFGGYTSFSFIFRQATVSWQNNRHGTMMYQPNMHQILLNFTILFGFVLWTCSCCCKLVQCCWSKCPRIGFMLRNTADISWSFLLVFVHDLFKLTISSHFSIWEVTTATLWWLLAQQCSAGWSISLGQGRSRSWEKMAIVGTSRKNGIQNTCEQWWFVDVADVDQIDLAEEKMQ